MFASPACEKKEERMATIIISSESDTDSEFERDLFEAKRKSLLESRNYAEQVIALKYKIRWCHVFE